MSIADDTIVFADTIEDLQILMAKITESSMRYGLDINTNKTTFMIISKEDITGVESLHKHKSNQNRKST